MLIDVNQGMDISSGTQTPLVEQLASIPIVPRSFPRPTLTMVFPVDGEVRWPGSAWIAKTNRTANGGIRAPKSYEWGKAFDMEEYRSKSRILAPAPPRLNSFGKL